MAKAKFDLRESLERMTKIFGDGLAAGRSPKTIPGLPSGEGATQLQVHTAPWEEIVPSSVAARKASWPTGPWQSEADVLFYEEGGLHCVIVRHPMGHLRGAVGVPLGHHALDAGPQPVHGGIATGMDTKLDALVKRSATPLLWHRFDCGHAWDYVPNGPPKAGVDASDYRDLRYVLRELEMYRRALCVDPRLREPAWERAFGLLGEPGIEPIVAVPYVLDLDAALPHGEMLVRIGRGDVAEAIAAEAEVVEPGDYVGRQVELCGVFRMHSGHLMLLTAGTVTNWEHAAGRTPSRATAAVSRDPDRIGRELRCALDGTTNELAAKATARAVAAYRDWRDRGNASLPTRAELQRVADALAAFEGEIDGT